MPKKKYNVMLSPAEESFLKSITHKGNKYSAREIIHAYVLLHSNDNRPQDKKDNRALADWLGISLQSTRYGSLIQQAGLRQHYIEKHAFHRLLLQKLPAILK